MWNQNNFSSLAQCIEGNSWTPLTTTRYPDLRSQIRHDHLVLLYPSKERIGLVFWNGLEEDFLLKIIHYFHSNASTAVAGNKSKRFYYYYYYYYYYYCYFIATLSYYCPFALFCCSFLLSLFNQCLINVAGIINSTLVLTWPGSNHVLQSPTLLLKWLSHESSFRSDNPIS